MENPIIVVGGSVREAQEYCKREGLGLGQAVILADYPGLHLVRARRPGFKVRFIGRFHERADAGQITNEVRVRGGVIEDITGSF